jgi:hypothetical protein
MRGRDCIRVALVLVLLAMPACAENGSERDLRIERPAAEGVDLLQAIVTGLESQMGDDLENEADVLGVATPGQRAVYALDWTTLEVNNGGWHQFFWNSSGALADEAIAGAELIGAHENAAILRQAAAVFPRGRVPEDRAERQRILDSLSDAETEDAFGPLEERWYARDPELERLMVAYVEAHPDEFFR